MCLMSEILRLENLSLGYWVHGKTIEVLRDVSFGIQKGEAFGLVGESGVGKSTLALELMGVLGLKNGRRIQGSVSHSLFPHEMTYIPQDPTSALDPLFSIGHQMKELGASEEDVHKALSKVHLPLKNISLKSYPHELSGGMLQRLLIGMALVKKPKLLIADEPTSSLDVIHQDEILKLFHEVKREGITILYITHNMPIAMSLCDRIAVLYQGKVAEINASQEIYENPKHRFTQKLIDAVPILKVDDDG